MRGITPSWPLFGVNLILERRGPRHCRSRRRSKNDFATFWVFSGAFFKWKSAVKWVTLFIFGKPRAKALPEPAHDKKNIFYYTFLYAIDFGRGRALTLPKQAALQK